MGTVGLKERIAAVRERIAKACQRCGRDPATVTLVAVTKGVSAATIQEALACGLTQLGENRIQEARSKQLVLGSGLGVEGWGLWASAPNSQPRTQNKTTSSFLVGVLKNTQSGRGGCG